MSKAGTVVSGIGIVIKKPDQAHVVPDTGEASVACREREELARTPANELAELLRFEHVYVVIFRNCVIVASANAS